MKRRAIQHHMDGLLALLLFGVFAACVLAVLLTGAGAYRRLTQRDQAVYNDRTCRQYLETRVRQADAEGCVRVEDFDGAETLVLADQYGYETRVYAYNGWLMELYAAPGSGLSPEDGEKVMELEGMSPSLEGGMLRISITNTDGTELLSCLSLRSGEGAPA